jgi:hypothetical protein
MVKGSIPLFSSCEEEIAMLERSESILALGMISMALGILVGRFLHFEYADFPITDFVEGVLTGLSLVMNLTYLVRYSKTQRPTSTRQLGNH